MQRTNLVQKARIRKKQGVVAYLKQAFKDFSCPVYLFGSYATEQFHGNSDVDILVISPKESIQINYREACDKMSGLGFGYDILVTDSLEQLDRSIVDSLYKINVT